MANGFEIAYRFSTTMAWNSTARTTIRELGRPDAGDAGRISTWLTSGRKMSWRPANKSFGWVLMAFSILSVLSNCDSNGESPSAQSITSAVETEVTATESVSAQTKPAPSEASGSRAAARPTEGPNEEPVNLVAGDGAASLAIPAGAIPGGVDQSTIRIERISDDDLVVQSDADPSIVAYALEPDGLEFLKPVELSITLDSAGFAIPNIWMISGEDSEPLPSAEIVFLPDQGQLMVVAPITHFSSIYVDELHFFKITISDPPDVHVGSSFDVTAEVEAIYSDSWNRQSTAKSVSFSEDDGARSETWTEYFYQTPGPWRLDGLFRSSGSIVPSEVPDSPADAEVTDAASYEAEATFTCVAPSGGNTVEYSVDLTYTVRTSSTNHLRITGGRFQRPGEAFESNSSHYSTYEDVIRTATVRSAEFSCLAAIDTPTPTTTPTETPEPTPQQDPTSTPAPELTVAETLLLGPECTADPAGDNDMLSDTAWLADPVDWTDIRCSYLWTVNGEHAADWFAEGGPLDCGATDFAGETSEVVCAEGSPSMGEGPFVVSRIDLAGPPPIGPDATHNLTYALVCDCDANPENNFEFQGAFTLDIFQGTDTWYTVSVTPRQGSTTSRVDLVDARGGGFSALSTAARAIFVDSAVIFVVPLNEFPQTPSELGFRQTAFAFESGQPISGTGSMDTAGADGPAFVDQPLVAPGIGPDIFENPPPSSNSDG